MENAAGQILKQELAQRQRRNSSYSLRAFARDLGVHPGTLGAVMAGKRQLPADTLKQIVSMLGLSPRKIRAMSPKNWLEASAPSGKEGLTIVDRDELSFQILSEWEYFAVMSLIDTKDFHSDILHVATRLGIAKQRAQVVVANLLAAGLMRFDKGNWIKINDSLTTSEDVESPALQKAHIDELELARQKLERTPVDERDYSSVCFATSREKLPAIKALIRDFREELIRIAEGEPSENTDVLQLCMQLFPLTEPGRNVRHDD